MEINVQIFGLQDLIILMSFLNVWSVINCSRKLTSRIVKSRAIFIRIFNITLTFDHYSIYIRCVFDILATLIGSVAELVDAVHSKCIVLRRPGSSPGTATKL